MRKEEIDKWTPMITRCAMPKILYSYNLFESCSGQLGIAPPFKVEG